MTVSELIKLLSSFPQDMKVFINLGKNELANGKEASSLREENIIISSLYNNITKDYFPELPLEEGEIRQKILNITSS